MSSQSLFHYPKSKHVRTQKPRVFKSYRTYKKYLQVEFGRVCVYCRQPDTAAPNVVFGVDHYRPKGLSQFSHLVCAYENLFYACNQCNSRKGDDWPVDEKAGPYVVNPCDFSMASHLRFIKATGRMDPIGKHGEHTETLLELNADQLVKYRLSELLVVSLLETEIARLEIQLDGFARAVAQGRVAESDVLDDMAQIRKDLEKARDTLADHTGSTPIVPAPASRLGVQLTI